MNNESQKFLLSLARKAIEYFLETQKYLEVSEKELPDKKLCEKQGTFVTLKINDYLRGCIGHIEPVNPIYKDIIENAVAAAFFDLRFFPLSKEEFEKIKIEISLLSVPNKLEYKDTNDLIAKLKEKPGVIVQKGLYKATFLPQVWEELPQAEDFLSHLCLKAGLGIDEWRKGEIEILTYTAEVFGE